MPREHEADFGRARRRGRFARPRTALRHVLGAPRATPRRPAVQPRPAYRAAPRARRRHVPLALGGPSRACARSPGSSSAPGLPVNPVSPEAAVEELLERAVGAGGSACDDPGDPRRARARPGVTRRDRPLVTRLEPAALHAIADMRRPAAPSQRRPPLLERTATPRASAGPALALGVLGSPMNRAGTRTRPGSSSRRCSRSTTREIYAYLVRMLRDARPRRRPGPGRVRQGVQELRHAREERERAGLAVPDRPPRGPRRAPPPQDRADGPVDRRVARRRAIGGAAGDGPSALRPARAGARADPRAPARGPPARRAARPHRPRARRGDGRQPRGGTGDPHPGPREPPPCPRRGEGSRARRRGRARRACSPARPGATDDPAVPRAGTTTARRPHDRARSLSSRGAARAARRGRRRLARAPPRDLRRVPAASATPGSPIASSSQPADRHAGAAARPVGPHRRGDRSRGARAPRVGAGCRSSGRAARSRRCWRGLPLGAAAGALVVVVVVGTSLVPRVQPDATPGSIAGRQ